MKKIYQRLKNKMGMTRRDAGKAALGIWKEE
jgi:hypothetical protein